MADGWRRCSMWWQRRRQCALFLANGQVGKDKIIARRRPDDQQNNQIKRHEEENFDDYCPLLNRLRSRNERWVRQYPPCTINEDKGRPSASLRHLDSCWPISLLHILVESLGISYLCRSFYVLCIPADAAVDADRCAAHTNWSEQISKSNRTRNGIQWRRRNGHVGNRNIRRMMGVLHISKVVAVQYSIRRLV